MTAPDYTSLLKQRMDTIGIASFRALAKQGEVSLWQVHQLRRGQLQQMRLASLMQLGKTLQLSFADLVATFSEEGSRLPWPETAPNQLTQQQEDQQLQQQLATQREMLLQEFQHTAFNTLESMLRYLPAVVHAAQQKPDLTATTVLRLLRPIDQLLQQWGIESIAPIGAEVAYDPRWHQLSQGTAEPGQLVRITTAGYRQGEVLLCRAGVERCEPNSR